MLWSTHHQRISQQYSKQRLPCVCTYDDVELGVDVDNSVFSVDDRQSGDSSADEHVDSIDESRLWRRLHQRVNQSTDYSLNHLTRRALRECKPPPMWIFSVVFARWHHTIFGRGSPYLAMVKNPLIPTWIQMVIRITPKIQSPISWAKSENFS